MARTSNRSVNNQVVTSSRRTQRVEDTETPREVRRWSREEDDRLVRQVKAFPQCLAKCFLIVSEEIGRTPGAVSNHWYTQTSKRPDVVYFFTASEKHVSKNRKNGMGVESTPSIWRRLMAVIRNL